MIKKQTSREWLVDKRSIMGRMNKAIVERWTFLGITIFTRITHIT